MLSKLAVSHTAKFPGSFFSLDKKAHTRILRWFNMDRSFTGGGRPTTVRLLVGDLLVVACWCTTVAQKVWVTTLRTTL